MKDKKLIITLLAIVFLFSAASRSEAQIDLRAIDTSRKSSYEIQVPLIKIPIVSPNTFIPLDGVQVLLDEDEPTWIKRLRKWFKSVTSKRAAEQPRIRYYPTQGYYYNTETRESKIFECRTAQSVIGVSNHTYYIQLKINGVWVDYPHYPTRVFIKDCDGEKYDFTALVPSNHDSNTNKIFKHNYDSVDQFDPDFD